MSQSEQALAATAAKVRVGDKVRFDGAGQWWTVQARDERFLVATVRVVGTSVAADEWAYTVVDLTGWADKRYNGAGNGPVRSSLNSLGGGWPLTGTTLRTDCEAALEALLSGEREISHRRVTNVLSIERKAS